MFVLRQENHIAHFSTHPTSNLALAIHEHLGRAGFASRCIHTQPARRAQDPMRHMSYRRELENHPSQDKVQSCAD